MKAKKTTAQLPKETKEKKVKKDLNQPRTFKVVFIIIFLVLFVIARLQGQSFQRTKETVNTNNAFQKIGIRTAISINDYSKPDGTVVIVKGHPVNIFQ